MSEYGDAFLAIELPFAVEPWIILRGSNVRRSNGSAVDATALPGRIAVHSDPIQLDHQRIARQRAFNIEWSGFEVPTGRAAIVVTAARIESAGADGIAGEDAQRRGIRGRVVAIKHARLVIDGARSAWRRDGRPR